MKMWCIFGGIEKMRRTVDVLLVLAEVVFAVVVLVMFAGLR